MCHITGPTVKISSHTYTSRLGLSIHRRDMIPVSPPAAGAIFLHGLGDHAARHQTHLRHFTDRGIYCTGIDLPGHGLSGGKRGCRQGAEGAFVLIEEALRHLRGRVPAESPIGLIGHSMGGFFALNYLVTHPRVFDFAWISSPLIDPRKAARPGVRLLIHCLGTVWPGFTVQSGVRSEMCKRDPEMIEEARNDPLVHRHFSAGLGRALLRRAATLQRSAGRMRRDFRLLMTHGSDDPICPSGLSREYFDRLSSRRKRYVLFQGLLHEPFNDIGREEVHETLGGWLAAEEIGRDTRRGRAA